MDKMDPRDVVIASLADRLYICSRLLTAAAERLKWDNQVVRDLMSRLNKSIEDAENANIEAKNCG